ncbi:heme A synthase [Bacillus sp. A301a_S52]|nr:heme A synthase [Bacillus sp. A301a_S52]
MHRLLKVFGILTSFGMLIVIIQGALVTQTGSGDACGAEWPLCHGRLIPENPTIETLIEYTHRLVSAILGIMVLIHSVWSWLVLKHLRETKFFAILAVLFIIFQGLLGAAAVVWGQSDAVMALHFGFSLVSFASVLLLTILAFENGKHIRALVPPVTRRVRNYYYFLVVFVYIVVYTGAYVKHTEAGIGCNGWPLCNGQFIPILEGRTGIQFGHRVAAALLFFTILAALIIVYKHYRTEKAFFLTTVISFILITLQVISGAIVVFSGLSLYATMVHAVLVSLLFGAVSYTTLLVDRSRIY